jgi:hypothetical protein
MSEPTNKDSPSIGKFDKWKSANFPSEGLKS